MNNLQQVINQAQSDISKGFVFTHIKTPDLNTLLDGLYDEQWKAIWYEGHIEDASRSADKWQQYYINLLEEHKAMKKALKWYADRENYKGYYAAGGYWKAPANDDDGDKARKVLSTLNV